MLATRFFTMGGMREIGKATTVIEHDEEIIIIDCGVKFANTIETGIDAIIPDYSYLIENQKKIVGLFLTHGHEDHIGGVPWLLKEIDIPQIYGSEIANELIKDKLRERRIKTKTKFKIIDKDLIFRSKHFTIDFWTTQHSIPDSYGIRVKTPNGVIVNTGDFRIDYSPIGNLTDFSQIEKYGNEGIDLFMSDSTNALFPSHSPTEARILVEIEREIKAAKGKIIFTSFASQVHRLQAVIEIAAKYGRKVCTFGRSMIKVIDISKRIKLINVPEATFVDKKQIAKLPPNKVFILSTGSQGEETANLSRVASGKQKWINLKKDDITLFSASPIPGNRMRIEKLINSLYKLGVTVKENKIDGIYHTSGHAYKEEHIKIFKLAKPKYFVPYHGSYRQAAVHGFTAREQGVDPKKIIIMKNGEVLELKNKVVRLTSEKIDVGPIYIDSQIATRQTSFPIKMRDELGKNGFINFVITVNQKANEIVGRTKIVSRGTMYIKESRDIISRLQRMAHSAALYIIKNKKNWTNKDVKEVITSCVRPYFYKIKRRNPQIITSIINYNATKQITNLPKKNNPPLSS